MTPQESFEAFLDRTIGPLPEGASDVAVSAGQDAWAIQDDVMADRVLRRLRHLHEEAITEAQDLQAMLAPLLEWFAEQCAIDERPYHERRLAREQTAAYLEARLRDYYEHLKAIGKVYKPKHRRSHLPYVLPHGTLEAYPVSVAFDVAPEQEAAALAWCKAHGLIHVTEKPQWGEVRKRLRTTDDGAVTFEHRPATEDEGPVRERVLWAMITREPHEGFRVRLAGDLQAQEGQDPEGGAQEKDGAV